MIKTGSVGWQSLVARSVPALIAALCAGAVPVAQGADSSQNKELVELKSDMQKLQAQQQRLLDGMDEIKKTLGKINEPPTLPPVTPPPTMNLAGESFRGEAGAPLVVIEYADFECSFCRHFEQKVYPKLRDNYINTGRARYYFRDMPLPFHSLAVPAANIAHCAAEQGQFWNMHDSLFAGGLLASDKDLHERAAKLGLDVSKLDDCVASDRFGDVIDRSSKDAAKMNIHGTPTFFIGVAGPGPDEVTIKSTIVGAEEFDAFKAALDPLLIAPNAPHTIAQVSASPSTGTGIGRKE